MNQIVINQLPKGVREALKVDVKKRTWKNGRGRRLHL